MDVGPLVEVNTITAYSNRRIGDDARPVWAFAHALFRRPSGDPNLPGYPA
jgi:hypothetical protein